MTKSGAAADSHQLERQLAEVHESAAHWALVCCEWNRHDAEDVLHTAYERVLSGKAKFSGQSRFQTWLFGVIRNCAREARRFRFRWVSLAQAPEATSAGSPDAWSQTSAETERLRRALLKLPKRQREVMLLVFYLDLTVEQAAEVLSISIGSARTHYARGKARLADILESYFDESG